MASSNQISVRLQTRRWRVPCHQVKVPTPGLSYRISRSIPLQRDQHGTQPQQTVHELGGNTLRGQVSSSDQMEVGQDDLNNDSASLKLDNRNGVVSQRAASRLVRLVDGKLVPNMPDYPTDIREASVTRKTTSCRTSRRVSWIGTLQNKNTGHGWVECVHALFPKDRKTNNIQQEVQSHQRTRTPLCRDTLIRLASSNNAAHIIFPLTVPSTTKTVTDRPSPQLTSTKPFRRSLVA